VGAGSGQALSTLVTPAQPGGEQQDAPLTEAERKQLNRFLSDPTYFPVEFRTWLRTYIEGSDIRLPSSAIVGGNAPKVNLPAGVILDFAGDAIPSNCLPCDGRALVRSDWDLLFQAIGTKWGAPSGSQFNIPDFRDRATYGAGTVVGSGGSDGRAFGSRGGPMHHHYYGQTSDPDGDHYHSMGLNLVKAINAADSDLAYVLGAGSGINPYGSDTDSSGDHVHFVSGDTSGGYDQDEPSWAGVNKIIATGKNI
jgi:microcystin-dependent protein